MKATPRKSRQLVNNFKRGKTPIQANTPTELAKKLRGGYKGGSIGLMACKIEKDMKGGDIFTYLEKGKTFYESYQMRRRRLGFPVGTPRSKVIAGGSASTQQVAA